jgi:hypothetical protein
VWREHFAGRGVCTDGTEESIAHTGGLFLIDPMPADARGRGTEAGVSEDMGGEVEGREWSWS